MKTAASLPSRPANCASRAATAPPREYSSFSIPGAWARRASSAAYSAGEWGMPSPARSTDGAAGAVEPPSARSPLAAAPLIKALAPTKARRVMVMPTSRSALYTDHRAEEEANRTAVADHPGGDPLAESSHYRGRRGDADGARGQDQPRGRSQPGPRRRPRTRHP